MDKQFKMDLQLFALTEIPAALVEKVWRNELFTAVMNTIYFARFTGTSQQSVIQKVDNLKKAAGDRVTIPLLLKLKGQGVKNDAVLEGNEEALEYRDFAVMVEQIRHGVRIKGRYEEQKTALKMRADAKNALATWWAELLDKMIFEALSAAPTANRVIRAGNAATTGAITPTNVFTAELIGICKRKALMDEVGMRPIKIDGKNHFVMVIDPYQARDLKNDTKWLDAQKHANVRGNENPIFSGALGMWDNVIVHENEGVIRANSGNNTMVGHALFLGAQAGVMAMAQEQEWAEDLFDYKNSYGVSTSVILGIGKTRFNIDGTNAEDFACINVLTASVAD